VENPGPRNSGKRSLRHPPDGYSNRQAFARAEKHGCIGQVHLIDESCTKVFSDCVDPAAQPDIFSIGSLASACKRHMYPLRDEVERSSTTHSQGIARVVGENEDRSVIWRITRSFDIGSLSRSLSVPRIHTASLDEH